MGYNILCACLCRHDSPDVALNNISANAPLPQEEVNISHEYEYIGFHKQLNVREEDGFDLSNCDAYGVHVTRDQNVMAGRDMGENEGNMEENIDESETPQGVYESMI